MKENTDLDQKKKQWINRVKNTLQWDMVVILPVALVVQAFLLMLGMQAVTFADYNVLYKWFVIDNLGCIIYNLLLFYVLLQLFFCIFKRLAPGYVITVLLTIIIAVINNMKWLNLQECVTISDFEKLSEAVKVAGEAEFNLFEDIWICVLIAICLLGGLVFLDYKVLNNIKRNSLKLRACRISLLLFGFVLISFIAVDAKKSAVAKLTESKTADKTGPIVYFIESIFTSYLDEPYTIKEAEASYDEYVEEGMEIIEELDEGQTDEVVTSAQSDEVTPKKERKPNVLVIMSEAFFDVNQFEGVVSYSEDPMSYYKEVQRESVASGSTRVNIYGGSTHFSEFEFLTGWNSKGMNSGSCPYKEYFNEEQPSFAGYLDEQGYYTLAIHPYDSYFWNRKNAYPNMGFDRFIDRSGMEFTDMCGYISDDALTNEIIQRYEERQGNEEEPFFCFGVSIANHVAMINREEFENTATHIDVTYHKDIGYSEGRLQRVKEYIGGISKTGEALKKLTDYFKKQDEPTVIVFFGDHAPNYAIDILRAGGKEELSYETPYLIWSNYDLDEIDEVEDMNVSYLSTYLIQILDMPLTEQNYYNIALHNEYLYETRYAIRNEEGESYDEFSLKEKENYFEHALDMKKHIPALLAAPGRIENIWSIP